MFYAVARGIFKIFLMFLGLKAEGLHNLPKTGPVIIAANHVSNWDPILVGVALSRPIHFMAKAELFENRLSKAIFTGLNAFPVKRGSADRNAIRQALLRLESGSVLGIFPEGARRKVVPEAGIQSGVAMLAIKSGSTVVPVAVKGTAGRFPCGWGSDLRVVVGKPVDLLSYQGGKPNSALLRRASQEIMEQINLLLCK